MKLTLVTIALLSLTCCKSIQDEFISDSADLHKYHLQLKELQNSKEIISKNDLKEQLKTDLSSYLDSDQTKTETLVQDFKNYSKTNENNLVALKNSYRSLMKKLKGRELKYSQFQVILNQVYSDLDTLRIIENKTFYKQSFCGCY